jgi:hypothetical protein
MIQLQKRLKTTACPANLICPHDRVNPSPAKPPNNSQERHPNAAQQGISFLGMKHTDLMAAVAEVLQGMSVLVALAAVVAQIVGVVACREGAGGRKAKRGTRWNRDDLVATRPSPPGPSVRGIARY